MNNSSRVINQSNKTINIAISDSSPNSHLIKKEDGANCNTSYNLMGSHDLMKSSEVNF